MRIALTQCFVPELDTDTCSIEDMHKVAEVLRATSTLLNAATQGMASHLTKLYLDKWQAMTMEVFFNIAKAAGEQSPANDREARYRRWLLAAAIAEDPDFLELEGIVK